MEEIGTSIVTDLAKCLWDPISQIMPSVKKWLEEVNAILEEVQKQQQELEGGGNKCFNVSLRYSLAKQMEDKANKMKELKSNSSFESFSQLIQLPSINTQFSSEGVMYFKSRESTYHSLLEAIKDGKNKMVGLLAWGLRSIQEEIKGKTGFNFEEPTDSANAQRLIIGLRSMKVLIILDDVWSKLNIQEIGISPNENCRILLTTRLRDVIDSMHCERTFELSLLTREEAWALLTMHANLTNVSFNKFDDVGRKIVDECKGLPIAVVTVGSALRGKCIVDWNFTLGRLQHSLPLDVDESSRGPFSCLELSYDYLSSLDKQLFLLCSMFPDDHEIHTEDLIQFAKGTLKFEQIAYTMKEVRNEILWSMPQSIMSSLMNLHTLCFRGIALGDISFLCHLKRLVILDLHGSQFDELPGGTIDMNELKLLDVF
ncbi:hypothetical protein K1719_033918 [Acacia pycnantha]|nr:hypothetical protein K1719_033918 [Acacia pycnantha]